MSIDCFKKILNVYFLVVVGMLIQLKYYPMNIFSIRFKITIYSLDA
ncbi:hypothetical protein GFV14_00092 [Candidatus Hartigia pinicola]|nr:hypothetical protein GFV14_00092 [Candidatus Hartigia pinicola]